MKQCVGCQKIMPQGMRPHAKYCSRACKTRTYSKLHPATAAENSARYLRERDKRRASAKAYQQANPHVAQTRKARRRQRLKAASRYTWTAKDWNKLLARHRGCCFYCGQPGKMTADHVIPISRGGLHSIGNIVPACLTCNSRKRTRTIMEWRMASEIPRWERRGCGATAAPRRTRVGSQCGRLLASA